MDDAGVRAPGQKATHITRLGPASVRVADGGGEELQETPAGPLPAGGDESRELRRGDEGELVHGKKLAANSANDMNRIP